MGELFTNGWTVSGILASGLGIGGLVWRRLSAHTSTTPPWYVRVARTGSAITKLQIAEGDLDAIKESLLLARQDGTQTRKRLQEALTEIEQLRFENDRLSRSHSIDSSAPSNAGSTARRGVRTRKKRTT